MLKFTCGRVCCVYSLERQGFRLEEHNHEVGHRAFCALQKGKIIHELFLARGAHLLAEAEIIQYFEHFNALRVEVGTRHADAVDCILDLHRKLKEKKNRA